MVPSGGGENLYYERIRLNIPGPAIKWDMLGSREYVGELADRLPARSITPLTPSYKNIFMKDIVIENCDKFIRAIGIPETKISNVVIENCNVSSKALVEISDVDGFIVKNTQIKTRNSAMNIAGANNIIWDNVKITTKD
ncbi:MAG: Polygalacturonase [Bacteroidetes bacterium]|nr:Polygalacturonase [Bacteroidota bacterium]